MYEFNLICLLKLWNINTIHFVSALLCLWNSKISFIVSNHLKKDTVWKQVFNILEYSTRSSFMTWSKYSTIRGKTETLSWRHSKRNCLISSYCLYVILLSVLKFACSELEIGLWICKIDCFNGLSVANRVNLLFLNRRNCFDYGTIK